MAKKRKKTPKELADELSGIREALLKGLYETKVRPVLENWLNAIQAKTRYHVAIETYGGITLTCVADDMPVAWDAAYDAYYEKRGDEFAGAETLRVRETFPDAIELLAFLHELDEDLVWDTTPTVPPKPGDDSLDPVDYITRGPLIPCARCEKKGHADWDLIHVAGSELCETCANTATKKGTA